MRKGSSLAVLRWGLCTTLYADFREYIRVLKNPC
jgi:hypothetical protein